MIWPSVGWWTGPFGVSAILTSGRMLYGAGILGRRDGRAEVRERWRGQRQRGQLHQQQHVVIGGVAGRRPLRCGPPP
jgi:hypothetical protein